MKVLNNDETSNENVQIIRQEEEDEVIQLAYEAKLGLLHNKAAKGILHIKKLTYSFI